MSQPPSSERPGAEKEGLSKYMKRMSTILRRGGSKRNSVSSLAEVTGGESSKAAAPKPTASTSQPADESSGTKPTPTAAAQPSGYQWSAVQQERARALFAKYGLTLDPEEWMSPRNMNVERVEKPIRMRVRRICHRCQTTFGPDKVCVNCQHVRCKKCARYPPARSKEEKEARAKAKAAEQHKVADAVAAQQQKKKQKAPPLTIPSRTGGQDLIHKQIKQRVRRTCHRCNTLFQGQATECTNCAHIRCKKCPRDPPKLHKYPDGYPGDVDPPPEPRPRVWRKPRQRVRYICHQCSTQYVPGVKECANCGQEKGPDTIRQPPRKVKPEPDAEVLRRVQERLAEFSLRT